MSKLLKLTAAVVLFGLIYSTFVFADAQCSDTCQLGQVAGDATCQLWDGIGGHWVDDIDDGPGQLHNRARVYLPWLRERLMPAGGVMSAVFADASYQTVSAYSGVRDPAIWTGAYLASEALRYMVTGAPDAEAQLVETLQVLHRWWNIPGDLGYLARFAAPASSPAEILATLPAGDDEVHINRPYDGVLWNWRGDVSRDQYQGVMLGYALAYEATTDLALRELIRTDVVEFAEQLMGRERRDVALIVNGQRTLLSMDLENVVYSTSDMLDGVPTLEIDLGSQDVQGHGLLVFWPYPSEFLRQIPGLGWLPDVELPTQAIQLAAIFRVALEVTDGIVGYEQRHQTLAHYYDQHFSEWLDTASNWENTNTCGSSYHGLDIAFMPMFNWARLEPDPIRRNQIQGDVLESRLWPAVEVDKNAFFAFIYASQARLGIDVSGIVAAHAEQLSGFPIAPNEAVSVDLRDLYPEDPDCPGQSAIAVDVSERVPATFMWERQPWKLQDPGVRNGLYGGIDYLLAYWMGRYFDFIAEDAPGTCLAYPSAARFEDVPYWFWAWPHIEAIAIAGITTGCGPNWYCPTNLVSRAEMAAFLLRGIHGGGYSPPVPTGTRFSDVPTSFWAAGWIEQLATEGITLGCGGGRYCPENTVTRAEMAVFLLRSKYGSAYQPPPATGTRFGDVPKTYWAASWIEKLAADGITTGCGGANYCPDNSVTRAEMAVFLARTFNLPLPPRP